MTVRGFLKKIVAVTFAGLMVFGSAMVTMADADSNIATDSEQTNAQGYKPGKVYTGDQNEFDAKGEALPGYHWDSKKHTDYVEGYYDTTRKPECGKTEHEHTAYTGTCYTMNTCDLEEHTHSTEENGCMGPVLICKEEVHTHSDKCYPYVQPILATYEFQMKADENTTN